MSLLVSAVITTYKREPEFLLRAVHSVLNQTYSNMELIVVDDSPDSYGFRDEIRKTLHQMDGVRYIAHEKNMGACAARNTGLYAAQGEYVAFLDDDDEWMPEKIEKQLRCFTRKEIGLVYCGNLCRNDSTGRITTAVTKYREGFVFDQLILENFIGSTSFPLLRKEYLLEIGGFDPLMKSAQDFDVWLRMAQKWEIAYVPEPLVVYHVHDGERITSTPVYRIEGQKRIIEKNKEYLACHKKAWWFRNIKIAPEYAQNRQLGKALRLWICMAIKRPYEIRGNITILYRLFRNYLSVIGMK